MLHYGARPPFSSEKFLEICRGTIPDGDIHIIKKSILATTHGENISPEATTPSAERKWRAFDVALRNELVKTRAVRKRLDPAKYMQRDGYTEPSVTHVALHAQRTPSIIHAEESLDRERWRVLDSIATGHYFDIDCLVVYAQHLLILERWQRINTADRAGMLENVVKQISDEQKDKLLHGKANS